MHKQKKVDFKKTLVRNTQKPIPKTKTTSDGSKDSLKKTSAENVALQRKPSKPIENKCEVSEVNLNLPELYSTLKISKEIDNIVKPLKTKSCSDVKKLAIDEKVSRKVNFPYDKPIYKDLIPLSSGKAQTQPLVVRNPLPPKDKEPVLSEFLVPREKPKYFYLPTVTQVEQEPVKIGGDNLRLYRILRKYDDS